MKKRYIIYTLSDPRTNEIRYVGKSSCGMKRARSHSYPSALKKDRTKCGNWIKSLKSLGMSTVNDELEIHDNHEDVVEAEIFYIAYFKSIGCNLTNHTTGGEGCPGRKMPAEQKEKLRQANLGNKHSLGKKRILTDEQQQRCREHALRLSSDPEIQKKISVTLTGKKQSLETIEKRASKIRGRKNGPHSEERKLKISLATKGKKKKNRHGRPIVDQQGNVYKSGRDAAEKLGFSRSGVYGVVCGKNSHCGGYVFKYVEQK